MKKFYFTLFSLISFYCFSQQHLKRVSNNDDYTIVEIFTFRNGTTSNTFTGSQNFLWTNNTDASYFYDSDLANSLGQYVSINPYNVNTISGIPSNNENICNNTISFNPFIRNGSSAIEGDNYGYYFGANLFSYQYQLMKIKEYAQIGDTNSDGLIDCYKFTCHIPKKMNNGGLIPTTNLWCALQGFNPAYSCGNNTVCELNQYRIWFKYDGTSWIYQTTLPNGIPNQYGISDICDVLSISDLENLEFDLMIYPNPTNNFITIQNKQNSIDTFEYKIVDLAGRIVKSGNSKFNEQINIESLTSGNYIIQIQTDSNQNFTQKLIKN